MNRYDLAFDQKVNVGHCGLYFMLHLEDSLMYDHHTLGLSVNMTTFYRKQMYVFLTCIFYTPATQKWRSIVVSRWTFVRPSVRFLFPDDNLSKHQWIFTKLGMCIDIVDWDC